jgi:hypothetical protein
MRPRNGICSLTGLSGQYVRCHLIPKSLTRLPTRGNHRIEAGERRRPIGRFDSWYDEELVVTKGEQILERLDDWAVKTLRENKLIWSGWQSNEELTIGDLTPAGNFFRTIHGINGSRLRLFFLSLLWRAGATKRKEFDDIQLSKGDLEILRQSISNGTPPDPNFYPVTLIQLSSKWDAHNQTPIRRSMVSHEEIGLSQESLDYFRFYFDGLITYFYIPGQNTPTVDQLGPIAVGNGEDLLITSVPFEKPWHSNNLRRMNAETEQTWPGVAMSIGKKNHRKL